MTEQAVMHISMMYKVYKDVFESLSEEMPMYHKAITNIIDGYPTIL